MHVVSDVVGKSFQMDLGGEYRLNAMAKTLL
jgi:hypothetical protein